MPHLTKAKRNFPEGTRPEQFTEHQLELEDALLPEPQRFDWRTISLCVSCAIKHDSYGMSFADYQKKRSNYLDRDANEKQNLTFYLPLFPSMISSDICTEYHLSRTPFIIRLMELGMITFQYDYHEHYSLLKSNRKRVSKLITTLKTKMCYLQMDKQTIVLNSCGGSKNGATKRYSPKVPDWFYNAASDAAVNLNMSLSDFCYLCWCIGMIKSIPEEQRNPVLNLEIEEILTHFNYELHMYTEQIKHILLMINDGKE